MTVLGCRSVRNRQLYDAIDRWAIGAINNSPGARAFYDQHRAAGEVLGGVLVVLGRPVGVDAVEHAGGLADFDEVSVGIA
jgi:hypothetical protein